jgi:uracil-DNA glycosylase family 4
MSPQPRNARRAARQLIATDKLLGMESVPLGKRRKAKAEDAPTLAAVPPPPARLASVSQPLVFAELTPEQKAASLAALDVEHAARCPHCSPQRGQLKMVFGDGDPSAELMFVGEGPGEEEDRQGKPFVGRAGQLLNQQIAAMGLKREQVYIANVVKCRPPNNRVPTPEEAALCMPFLVEQVRIVHPKVIVCLGATATKYLLDDPTIAITRIRGTWFDFHGVALMPTFHPAYLLRQYTVENRRRVWEDLQKVMEKLGIRK